MPGFIAVNDAFRLTSQPREPVSSTRHNQQEANVPACQLHVRLETYSGVDIAAKRETRDHVSTQLSRAH